MKIRHFFGLLAALVVGVGLPYFENWLACYRQDWESCVWGKALMPVNIAAHLVILGIPAFLLVVWLFRRRPSST